MRTVFELDPLAVLAFVAVAEHGSFRGAARALAIPKSTLSQRVAALEAHLGAQLLVRTTRSVQLTDVGASYQRDVSPAIEALRAAEATVAQLQAKPSGRLRITAPYELGLHLLPAILAEYGTLYPDVVLDVYLADRIVNLVEEGYDLAIRIGPLADSGLVARRLGSPKGHGVYASRAYLKRSGTPRLPGDLAKHRCLVMSGAQTPTTWTFEAGRTRSQVQIRPVLAVNSFDVLTRLARAGLGVVAIPEQMIEAGPDEPLRRLLTGYRLPVRQSFAVYPSARNVSPALRALVDSSSSASSDGSVVPSPTRPGTCHAPSMSPLRSSASEPGPANRSVRLHVPVLQGAVDARHAGPASIAATAAPGDAVSFAVGHAVPRAATADPRRPSPRRRRGAQHGLDHLGHRGRLHDERRRDLSDADAEQLRALRPRVER